ncbi:hypothetical protein [Halogeometricum borinquense]|uniref:Uncharacterized protein n=1 Tax=Halogeometricum borinquense (strain ATCC 700274 / DSM 11551 / JCM 10706 / KCTC 4070 / PR3) TaxID=469382 RepID=E4NPY9_HALBP|nr:hypothetical protein [Halogeometricum borinquense]ADQ67734.1 hypothetical protein Hbor_21700 [Halogeometricum borinquense DSM 11551]
MNHKLSRKGKLKSGAEIGLEDIEIISHRDGDRPHYVLDSDKWDEDIDLTGDSMHDFKHIVARHGHPAAGGDWPISPGTAMESVEEAFPETMGPADIKQVIETAIEEGEVGGNSGELVYDGHKLDKYDISQIHVRRNSDSGIVQTAFASGENQ